jgi:hypothetical protein
MLYDNNFSRKSNQPHVFLTLEPNQSSFKNFFKDLIEKYEKTAGKIQTLLHEPKFNVFYEQPIYELTNLHKQVRLSMNIEDWENKYKDLQPWPEVAYLFGEDENYQDLVLDIMSNITLSITNISNYMKVNSFLLY